MVSTEMRCSYNMMPAEYFLAHIWMIPLFPLAGAALMLFIGRRCRTPP